MIAQKQCVQRAFDDLPREPVHLKARGEVLQLPIPKRHQIRSASDRRGKYWHYHPRNRTPHMHSFYGVAQ